MSFNFDYNSWDNDEERYQNAIEFAKMFAPEQPQNADQPVLKDENLNGKKIAKPVQLSIFDLQEVKVHISESEQC